MSDPESPLPPPASGEPPSHPFPDSPPDEVGASALRQFLGLFVVPLVVVFLCVAVFIGFGWIAHEKQTTSDSLNELRSGWKPRRTQAAYELSKILTNDPHALDEEPGAKAQVRTLFQETEEPEIRQYLAVVLGRTHDREALPLLVAALKDKDDKTRIYALWALGTLGDPRARGSLEAALGDPDPGMRKTAAFALGELGDRAAVPALLGRLDDRVADVRWNTALSLSRLGSRAGVPVLEAMLERRLLGQVADITPEQEEEAMVSALHALAALGAREDLPRIERLAAADPSLKVRQAALEAKKALAPARGQPRG